MGSEEQTRLEGLGTPAVSAFNKVTRSLWLMGDALMSLKACLKNGALGMLAFCLYNAFKNLLNQ